MFHFIRNITKIFNIFTFMPTDNLSLNVFAIYKNETQKICPALSK